MKIFLYVANYTYMELADMHLTCDETKGNGPEV